MHPTTVLATISGRDRPGITASFFAALAAHDVDVHDVEQVVIRDRLVLAVLFDLRGDSTALRNSVTKTASALGMESEVVIADIGRVVRPDRRSRHQVLIIGRPLRPGALSHVAQRLADIGANIDSMTRLPCSWASSLELAVRAPSPSVLRSVLFDVAHDTGLDIAVEPAALRRRPKRLVVLDIDATLLRDDPVDALARRAGVQAEVAAVQAQTVAGELDFAESLHSRASLLAGLTENDVRQAEAGLRFVPGAHDLVHRLRRAGYHVAGVSGSLTSSTDLFVDELGLEVVAVNCLEIRDGVVTGRLADPIVDSRGKAAAARRFAERFGVTMSQTVAIGDGARDAEFLEAAGLGVAFTAKSGPGDPGFEGGGLPYVDSVLFVLGVSDDEITAERIG